jgi:transcriptional regulator with GAF, ATPase, and Fis domain
VDVRVIATTNRHLSEEVAAGRFRADLFFRLNVYPLTVPSLRNRREDIPLLVCHFVPQIAGRLGKTIDQIPAFVMEQLTNYDWPGNVRELKNVLERAVITSSDGVLRLPEKLAGVSLQANSSELESNLVTLESVERQHILRVLEATDWRISGPKGAANILGLNPSTLRFRMKKLGLKKS